MPSPTLKPNAPDDSLFPIAERADLAVEKAFRERLAQAVQDGCSRAVR
jgi:hypothetical protein